MHITGGRRVINHLAGDRNRMFCLYNLHACRVFPDLRICLRVQAKRKCTKKNRQ